MWLKHRLHRGAGHGDSPVWAVGLGFRNNTCKLLSRGPGIYGKGSVNGSYNFISEALWQF